MKGPLDSVCDTNVDTFPTSYTGDRQDIAGLIPANTRTVLDIGCATGSLGAYLKRQRSVTVTSIETSEAMAAIATERLDRVIVGDFESIRLEEHFESGQFGCIILADVLEHFVDPWGSLRKAVNYLGREGMVVASIPNIRHFHSLISVYVMGYWPYRERGIHDRSHLRFFTQRNIDELLSQADLKVTQVMRKYRIIERPNSLNRFSRYFTLFAFRNFLAYQFLISAERREGPKLEKTYATSTVNS